jgi:hypothetical protein
LLAACGGSRGEGQRGSLVVRDVLVRGALGYDVALDGPRAAAVVLDREFQLVWIDLPSGAVTARVPLGDPAYDCEDVDVAGARAVVACRDGRVRVLDGERVEHELRLDGAATAVAFAGDHFVTGSSTGVLCLRRTADAALLQCVAEHTREISALAVEGDVLTSGALDGSVVTWDLPSLRLRERRRVHGAVTAIAGTTVAYAAVPPRLPARGRGWVEDAPLPAAPAGLVRVGGRLLAATWAPSLGFLGEPPLTRFPHVLRGLAASDDGGTLLVVGFALREDDPTVTRVDVVRSR